MFDLDTFKQAEKRIRATVGKSPLVKSAWLSKELDAEVYLKLECMQPGRSFKIRGATNALLSADTMPKKVITASGGNHGLGVAIASKRAGIPSLIVLPTSTPSHRVDLLRDLGADVLLYGVAYDEANEHAKILAKESDTLYIHAFADDEVIVGQGTISLELVNELGSFDILVASIGGGGLLSGITLGLKAQGLVNSIEIIAVETEGANCFAASLAEDRVVELKAITSIAKTLGAKATSQFNFETLKELVNESVVVTDKEAVEALNLFLDHEKILVEPATSCIFAAALKDKEKFRGKKVVFIVCGSNVTLDEFRLWNQEFLNE
ncbi:MAG: pyridoxal-phosphate dependent enzyme [Candidatus Heimdallarchaeota archaeon]|nr:pyridoxal-phosphate dependent enzyme [Candidatus Heimdallarchaeota archaeon]